MFRKILIANRGEIALRIQRSCRALGIKTVAVYCDGEENSLPVLQADEAYGLGPPLAGFLDAARLARLAKESGCQALHPGYGFLSEQPSLAAACRKAGIVFIGPSASTLRLAGDKVQARKLMHKAGVPVLPGSAGLVRSASEARRAAHKLGFPLLIKAAYGGGGKGMKIAANARALEESFDLLRQESQRSFGKAGVFLERYVAKARHIEVQILADKHGHCVHLGERNCSLQRRHQKLLEEAPSPGLDAALREKLFAYALKAAEATHYENAGTVEFLADAKGGIYFLEINARIQVEHAVTEAVTGLDLIAEQIAVAAGKKLGFAQKDITFHGHAMECRLYAENPFDGFLPSTGTLDVCRFPAGPGIRVDSAAVANTAVSPVYDPLLAKIIAHGRDRAQVMARMQAALSECLISPVQTTLPLFQQILRDKAFRQGKVFTDYLLTRKEAPVPAAVKKQALLLKELLQKELAQCPMPPAAAPLLAPSLPGRNALLDPWKA